MIQFFYASKKLVPTTSHSIRSNRILFVFVLLSATERSAGKIIDSLGGEFKSFAPTVVRFLWIFVPVEFVSVNSDTVGSKK